MASHNSNNNNSNNNSILLIGATGRTGALVLSQALARGIPVTALVRNAAKLAPAASLTVVQGSPTDASDILRAISSSPGEITGIIVTLNAPRASDSPFAAVVAPPRLMADAHVAIVQAMRQRPGIRKLVTLSAFGAADSRAHVSWWLNLLFRRTNMAAQYEDHDLVDAEVKASGVPFVLVRPMRLVDGEEREEEEDGAEIRQWGDRGEGVGMLATISRGSVARFLVDAVQGEQWDGRTPVISN